MKQTPRKQQHKVYRLNHDNPVKPPIRKAATHHRKATPASAADSRAVLAERENLKDAIERLEQELSERQREYDSAAAACKLSNAPADEKELVSCSARLRTWKVKLAAKLAELDKHIDMYATEDEIRSEIEATERQKAAVIRENKMRPLIAAQNELFAKFTALFSDFDKLASRGRPLLNALNQPVSFFDALKNSLGQGQRSVTTPSELISVIHALYK